MAFMLLSLNVFAVEWNNLEINKSYRLTQSFQLTQTERSHSKLDVSKGQELNLVDIIPLDMINVILFKFRYADCPGPAMLTDMEIIPVQETKPVVEVGAQLKNCHLELFLETKDYMSPSFLD